MLDAIAEIRKITAEPRPLPEEAVKELEKLAKHWQ